MLTSANDEQSMREGIELGADHYLAKPVSAATLLSVVEALLKKRAVLREQSDQALRKLRANLIRALPHELNTPLNGILGCAEMLRANAGAMGAEEIVEMADGICVSASRLHRVARNYLAYARTEMLSSDSESLQKLRASVTDGIRTVVEGAVKAIASESRRLSDLQVDLQGCAPLGILKEDLHQIVDELAQNAFKFSKAGTPVQINSAASPLGMIFRFIDRGRGMKPDQIANIEAYNQFERETYAHEGLGLGVVITQRLTTIYGGSFRIDSRPGEGTSVTVCIPYVRSGSCNNFSTTPVNWPSASSRA
jgi:signal transduction histidine kinase